MSELDAPRKRFVPQRPPVIAPGHTLASVTDKIASVVLGGTPRWFYLAFGIAFAVMMMFLYAVLVLFAKGVGIWGVMVPVGWGFAIVNFVWWIGIGHAGTLISAILLLMRQTWRTSINRFAEAMTLFAVAQAALFPILHLGRPWLFYWLLPHPNTMTLWPQFRSPLIWDVFAVTTYMTVSLLFWFMGLIPDLATLRDRAKNAFARVTYGVLAMGWRGEARHWHNYESAYYLMAALATPLVVSVHTVVSFDFAVGVIPGWHTTIFPPYFVAGAIFSGFAMVASLAIPLRAAFGLQDFITERHLQNMAKIMLVTGLIVAYGYVMELFTAWYSVNSLERYAFLNRITGPYRAVWFALILCNVATAQLLWSKRIRGNTKALWFISLIVNTGMWLERFLIVIVSLHRDFLPSSWAMYSPTRFDWMTFIGTLGFFMSLMFLFIRFLPMIAIFEMRTLVPGARPREAA